MLKTVKVDIRLFQSEMSRFERDEIVDSFNDSSSRSCQAMACSYSVGGQGLGLQIGSHKMCQVEPPANQSQDTQAVGRSYRVGQMWDVHILRLYMHKSHDDWVFDRYFQLAYGNLRDNEQLMRR